MTEYKPGDKVLVRAEVIETGHPEQVTVEFFSKTDQWRGLIRRDMIERGVVLDVGDFRGKMTAPPSVEELPDWLRRIADNNPPGKDSLGSQAVRLLADQIEAQTKPPRIPEPGLWGVVEAGAGRIPVRRWVHHEEQWWVADTGDRLRWEDLDDPIAPVRPGIEDEQ